MARTSDPLLAAEHAIEQAIAALVSAQDALQRAKTGRAKPAGRRSSIAHRLAEAIAMETAPGLPLDDPTCRRVYIASFEAYNAAQRAGQSPARAKMAAYTAAQAVQENLL